MNRPQEPRKPYSFKPEPFHRNPVEVGSPKIYYSGSRINETEEGFTAITLGGYDGNDIIFTNYVYAVVPNTAYESQIKMYEDAFEKYEKDRIAYEKAMAEYTQYQQVQKEQEELKLYETLKKKFEKCKL